MKVQCEKCLFIIDKDKYINDLLVEEYFNVYGTYCPNCSNFIEPTNKPLFVQENELKNKILEKEVIDRLKEKIGVKNGNRKKNSSN